MDSPVGRSADGLEGYMQRLLLRDATLQRRASETAANANGELSIDYLFGLRQSITAGSVVCHPLSDGGIINCTGNSSNTYCQKRSSMESRFEEPLFQQSHVGEVPSSAIGNATSSTSKQSTHESV